MTILFCVPESSGSGGTTGKLCGYVRLPATPREEPLTAHTTPEKDTRVAEPELTQVMVAAAMERAQNVICPPLDDKCYGLPFDAAQALAERTPKGWCLIGWVVRDSGRESWDAWYNVLTGEGRLRKQENVR